MFVHMYCEQIVKNFCFQELVFEKIGTQKLCNIMPARFIERKKSSTKYIVNL